MARSLPSIFVLTLLVIPPSALATCQDVARIPFRAYPDELTLKGVIGPGEYAGTVSVAGVTVHWMHDGQRLYIGLSSPGKGYVSIGWRKSGEGGWANLIVAWVEGSGAVKIEDRKIRGGESSLDDQNVLAVAGKEGSSGTVIEFVYPLMTGDPFDPVLRPGDTIEVNVAYHAESDDPSQPPTSQDSVTAVLEETPYPGSEAFWLVARSDVDAEMNSDLAQLFFLGLKRERVGGLEVVLGGPAVNGDWPDGLVEFVKAGGYYVGLKYVGVTLMAEYGYKDYAAVIPVKSGDQITLFVGGVTRYGTRAALLWAATNFQAALTANLTIVYWRDKNGNGEVDPLTEIMVEARA